MNYTMMMLGCSFCVCVCTRWLVGYVACLISTTGTFENDEDMLGNVRWGQIRSYLRGGSLNMQVAFQRRHRVS